MARVTKGVLKVLNRVITGWRLSYFQPQMAGHPWGAGFGGLTYTTDWFISNPEDSFRYFSVNWNRMAPNGIMNENFGQEKMILRSTLHSESC